MRHRPSRSQQAGRQQDRSEDAVFSSGPSHLGRAGRCLRRCSCTSAGCPGAGRDRPPNWANAGGADPALDLIGLGTSIPTKMPPSAHPKRSEHDTACGRFWFCSDIKKPGQCQEFNLSKCRATTASTGEGIWDHAGKVTLKLWFVRLSYGGWPNVAKQPGAETPYLAACGAISWHFSMRCDPQSALL
jgi:hypothetical protein